MNLKRLRCISQSKMASLTLFRFYGRIVSLVNPTSLTSPDGTAKAKLCYITPLSRKEMQLYTLNFSLKNVELMSS